MAKRSKTRTVYRYAKRGYSRRKGLLSGNMGNIVWGAGLGAVSGFIPNFLGGWTKPVIFGAGGYLLKKPAMLTVAGYEAGKTLMGTLGGQNSFQNGGWL